MKKLLIIALLLASCGTHGPMLIYDHEVSEKELYSICNNPPCNGHTKRTIDPEGRIICDIFMLPYDEYANSKRKPWCMSHDEFYNEVAGHEYRHCRGGYEHGRYQPSCIGPIMPPPI